ncbi:RICIN domain-containing protein [Streptomyces sp. NPDC020898]|uniref:RICIN domain-containing protein n=1 Tax=Streptomyces sp. NPDC020898 TaxID=3365101 RepID=UPI0037AA584D
MTDQRRDHTAPARRLGEALRGLQQRSGCTLRALEKQVCISDSSLSRYFRGDTVPPWPVVRSLCQAMGADPAEYRALWEAADRTRPDDPPATSSTAAPSTPHSAATARWSRLRELLAGRWAFAAAGAAAGALLALLTLNGSPTAPPAHGSAAELQKEGEPSSNARKPPAGARIFISRATGSCLDDSLDYGLRSFKCNHLPYQWWTIRPIPDGSRQIRSQATGRCIADSGTGLRIQDCSASPAQHWTLNAGGDEAITLKNTATGHCLDDSSAGLRTLPCSSTHHQKWA